QHSSYKVQMGLLTDYLPQPKADIIKLDVDGGEPYLMDSLFEVIHNSGSMSIFMEYLPYLWGGTDPAPILERFAKAGFQFYWLQRDGKTTKTSVTQLAGYQGLEQLDLVLVR